MKKLLVIIVVALLLLATPYLIGSHVESKFRDIVEQSNQHSAFQITVSDYQKGWFNSTAIVELSVNHNPAQTSGEAFTIKMNHDIQHGPVLWKAKSPGLGLMDVILKFSMPDDVQKELNALNPSGEEFLSLTARTSLSASTAVLLDLKSFSFTDKTATFQLKPASGEFTFDADGHITGSSKLDGFKFTQDNGQLIDISNISLKLDQQLIDGSMLSPYAFYAGDANFNINKVMIKGNTADELVNVEQINLLTNAEVNDDITNISIKIGIDALEAQQMSFTDIIYDISLENLGTEVLKKANRAVAEAQNQPNYSPMSVLPELQGLLPQFIEKEPMLKINQLGLISAQGKVDSNLSLSIDKNTYDPANPMTLMLSILAEAKGYAPEAFFEALDLAPNIDDLIQQKMLVRDDSNVKFEFSYKNGQALLNGNPMPVGGF